MNTRNFFQLGAMLPANGAGDPEPYELPAEYLVTHGVILGMTGSGKSGLAIDIKRIA